MLKQAMGKSVSRDTCLLGMTLAIVTTLCLAACGSKTLKCDSSRVEAALQKLFQKNAGAIVQRYIWPSPDPVFLMRAFKTLNFGMLDDKRTIFFPPGEAEKIKWSFNVVGIASDRPEVAVCSGRATYARDDLKEGFDFNFEARATDDGGAYVKLTD